MPTRDTIKQALEAELAHRDIKEAYLFGSFAREDNETGSDIDLRFLCGNTMTFGELYDIQLALEQRLGADIDIVTAPPSQMDPGFYDLIKQDEVLLYEAG